MTNQKHDFAAAAIRIEDAAPALRLSLRVASGLSSVWSIIDATPAVTPPAACRPRRVAPASMTPRSRSGQHSYNRA